MKFRKMLSVIAAAAAGLMLMGAGGREDRPPLISPRPPVISSNPNAGWKKLDNGDWHYYENEAETTGWKKIDNYWFYFTSEGVMKTGWLKLNNTWYFLEGSGRMATGWRMNNHHWYYFNPDGSMCTGWVKVKDKWYFMDRSGAMLTGYTHDGKDWYYLDKSGAWDPNYTGAETLPNGRKLEIKNDKAYVDGILIVNKKYPLPASHNPGGLTQETQAAFAEMQQGAARDGYNLYVVSGFRNYNYQKNLYNNYVNRDGRAAADRYSARAGYSEHQSGLAFDVNHAGSAFDGTREAAWMAKHAHEYGFIIRFPKGKEQETGYMYESWHLRYVGKDAAREIYESGLCLEEYLGVDSYYIY